MTVPAVTPLGYALLGLIREAPRSGYGLRKVFETTPLGSYSSSPGSIYPALKALDHAGLVERVSDSGMGGRVFRLTAAGEARLYAWLEQPVDAAEMADRRDVALLRFAFLQYHPDRRLSLAFLDGFAAAAGAQAAELERFLEGPEARSMTLHSRLAVEHALEGARSAARWAKRARQRLER
jgi:DNA-binding PadR family transcriptional regulator